MAAAPPASSASETGTEILVGVVAADELGQAGVLGPAAERVACSLVSGPLLSLDLLSSKVLPPLLGQPLSWVGPIGPSMACAPGSPVPTPRGYLWIPKGCSNPFLGFPASATDIRRSCSPPRSIVLLPPPLPLLRSFAEVVVMDQSRGSSSERNTIGKCHLEGSGEASAEELAYEAELRAKLECEHAVRDRAAKEREAWGFPPVWFREEERRKEKRALEEEMFEAARQKASAAPSPTPPAAATPDLWESAVAGSQAPRSDTVRPPASGSRPPPPSSAGGSGPNYGAGQFKSN